MSQIVDVILFCSKFSKPSMACVNFIKQNKIPVLIVPLDNEEDRALAMNGENVKITSVPSLVIAFDDGKVQMFVGTEKIIGWFTAMRERSEPNGQPRGPPPNGHPENPNGQPNGHPSGRQKHRQEIEEESDDEPPPPPKKSKKKTKSSGKKYRDSPVEIITEDGMRPSKPPPPSTHGLSTSPKPNNSNKNLMNAAKEMEAARNQTLGIRHGEI